MSYAETEGGQRLLQLADILDDVDAQHRARGEPLYSQDRWAHMCGTPACALGHWAAENRERWHFMDTYTVGLRGRDPHTTLAKDTEKEFGIDFAEHGELFGTNGCGGAANAKEAANYIRDFVFRKSQCEVQS